MSAPAHTLSLEPVLEASIEAMQQLLQLLKYETEMLKNNDIEGLEKITGDKTRLAEKIERLEQQRIVVVKQQNADPAEPRQWLINATLQKQWQKLRNVSEQAQRQNQVNGLVINGRRNSIQTQIEILCNARPATDLVYSANGKNIKQDNSSTLARA